MGETDIIEAVGGIVLGAEPELAFTSLEIGARPLAVESEPAHALLKVFPGSRVLAFEVEEELCADLNKTAQEGLTYYPTALGKTEESRPFYETEHPMCASLYRPADPFVALYNNLEVLRLKKEGRIDTVSLDHFASQNDVGPIDFIKIDIQGAELDVFQGGEAVLADTLAVVTEVEFVPLYENQPLFGDVSAYLHERGLWFHKFLGMSGRTLKPLVMRGDPNFASQHMWSDAVFMRSPAKLDRLAPAQVLKLAVLALLYGSIDVTAHCLAEYDRRTEATTVKELFALLKGG